MGFPARADDGHPARQPGESGEEERGKSRRDGSRTSSGSSVPAGLAYSPLVDPALKR